MNTHNICFHGEKEKYEYFWVEKSTLFRAMNFSVHSSCCLEKIGYSRMYQQRGYVQDCLNLHISYMYSQNWLQIRYFFQSKTVHIFLISPQKHVVGTQ